jgi:hypothetical protein
MARRPWAVVEQQGVLIHGQWVEMPMYLNLDPFSATDATPLRRQISLQKLQSNPSRTVIGGWYANGVPKFAFTFV